MARSNPFWFEFNGVKSSEMGVWMTDAHAFSRGEQRGTQEKVSGRSGFVWLGDGATDAYEIKRACIAPASKLRQIAAWLTGSGNLRFSNEEGAMYDARVAKKIDFKRAAPGKDPLYKFDLTFLCQPFPRMWPEVAPIEILIDDPDRPTPYFDLPNPGTAPSLPRLEIEGSGSFSVTIGKQTIFFSDVERGIIVDSELMDALTLDGALLANEKMDGEFFEIQPGQNVVQWIEGGESEEGDPLSGTIEKITIIPRWRML